MKRLDVSDPCHGHALVVRHKHQDPPDDTFSKSSQHLRLRPSSCPHAKRNSHDADSDRAVQVRGDRELGSIDGMLPTTATKMAHQLTRAHQGVSYTLSTQSLPSLLTLPSAKPAAYTLGQQTRLATLHIRTLSSLSTLSLALAYYLSPSRVRHPYLIWTGLVAAMSGGLNLAMDKSAKQPVVKGVEEDFVEVGGEVNGEQVEKRARDQQWIEFVRTGVSGVGECNLRWLDSRRTGY